MSPEEAAGIKVAFEGVTNPWVVNLGAYCGEDESTFKNHVCSGQLHHLMVEPDHVNSESINGPFLDSRILIKGAVGRETGVRMFWPSVDVAHGSGSILEPSEFLKQWQDLPFGEPYEVPCYSLDHIYRVHGLQRVDLLWVDIQGAEKEMIEGGCSALACTRYLFMEVEGAGLYQGQAGREELLGMLENWELVSDFDFNVLLRNKAYVEKNDH